MSYVRFTSLDLFVQELWKDAVLVDRRMVRMVEFSDGWSATPGLRYLRLIVTARVGHHADRNRPKGGHLPATPQPSRNLDAMDHERCSYKNCPVAEATMHFPYRCLRNNNNASCFVLQDCQLVRIYL